MQPAPSMFISALGTTKAQAGSLEAQRAVDYDLNLALARAAKDAGVKVYVLISVNGASTSSMFPYTKMKGELEDAVKQLGFPHTVIVRPGLITGGKRSDSRPAEAVARGIASGLGMVSKHWLVDSWAQDADVIGKAAISAGTRCAEGKEEEGVWGLNQADIIRLGRTERK